MNILWRAWLKIVLAAGLVVGCNTLAPALAMAPGMIMAPQDGDCHHSGQKGDANITVCKVSCLAVAAIALGIDEPAPRSANPVAGLARALSPLLDSPEPPPPRA